MPSRVARLRLAQAVETQFDTSIVAAFEAVLAMATEPYRMAQSPEFSFEWQQDEAEAREAGFALCLCRFLTLGVYHLRVATYCSRPILGAELAICAA